MHSAIYAAYLTGSAGSNIALLYIGNGILAGIDGSTSKYAGTYKVEDNNSLSCRVKYTLPSGRPLITGGLLERDTDVELDFSLPDRFWELDFVRVETPTGAVNLRFEKMKEIQ